MSKAKDKVEARHQVKSGTYLVVADGSEEFDLALKYAGQMAVANHCHVGILYVIENSEFQQWGNVEARMRREQYAEAEERLNYASFQLSESGYGTPSFYVEEGGRMAALSRVIENDPNIRILVLGASTHSGGAGPLVSHFTGKGLPSLRVPIMIVPEHLEV
ncbi:MAG: universal stress protein [Alphaproteobacteria bacterium]